jgi:hypothetical protein
MVPSLMFWDVTTMLAAVAVVLATTAETIAAMSAFFMAPSLGVWKISSSSLRKRQNTALDALSATF